ncbi:twin-arginine translocation signal domain-containing protein [Candidatus Woesearchaeota archaeon]|nr:twin-arginine translocation signal domain-containing protein [Candidatus Woesearchaeota archaeon]
MTKEDKQDEKLVHYEQPNEDKSDYTSQRTYEKESTDRRDFLRKAGTAVVVGLSGVLLGKTALADGIDGGIDKLVGDEGGLKRVTEGYSASSNECHPDCGPHCYPECQPPICYPDCTPNCWPNCDPNEECKPLLR